MEALLAAMEGCLCRDYQAVFGPKMGLCSLLMAAQGMALSLAFCHGEA